MLWTVSTQKSTVINFRCVLPRGASFKPYFNAVPKNTFWNIFVWTSRRSSEEFSKSIAWKPINTYIPKIQSQFCIFSEENMILWRWGWLGGEEGWVRGWQGYLYVSERGTNSDSPFHGNCKDWSQLKSYRVCCELICQLILFKYISDGLFPVG